jgi:hypothetical protein
MDALFTAKQVWIEHQKEIAIFRYPELWAKMIADWSQPGAADCAWLMYSANYLFRTGGLHWAVDPLTLKERVPSAAEVDVLGDLQCLKLILLTHNHPDHLDFDLLAALRDIPIQWVIPEAICDYVIERVGLHKAQIVPAISGRIIRVQELSLLPFDGLHMEKQPDLHHQKLFVPATGFLVEFDQKRCLLPGDTRRYDASLLPAFGSIDSMFAHLWLGRGQALTQPPPLLEEFCRFCCDLQPGKLYVTHLHEFGRDAKDLWDRHHFEQVKNRISQIQPGLKVFPVVMGEKIWL